MAAGVVDSEVLITLVEARPVLWDKTLDNYKDRNLTSNAWKEVCIALNDKFEELGDKEKNAFGKEVIRRWTNLRDAFAKSLKKMKESKSSGSAAKRARQYVFNDELKFLTKLYAEREISDSLSEDVDCVPVEEDAVAGTSDSEVFKTPTATRRHKKVDEIELKILKALEPKVPEKPNPNISFFHSLLTHLNNSNSEEILQFQMGVLQLISTLNERKKTTVHPPQYSQQTNYNPTHLIPPSVLQYHNQPQQSLISGTTNPIFQQYPQYGQHRPFHQFSQSPAVSSQSQPLRIGTPSTNLRNPVDETDLYTSEFTHSEVSSPESIPSSVNSVDFTFQN